MVAKDPDYFEKELEAQIVMKFATCFACRPKTCRTPRARSNGKGPEPKPSFLPVPSSPESFSTSASLAPCRGSGVRSLLRSLMRSRRSDRGFEAVVIGEPTRAFSGNQCFLDLPAVRSPRCRAVGARGWRQGRSGSDAHEMLMSLYGGMASRRAKPHQDPGPLRHDCPGSA